MKVCIVRLGRCGNEKTYRPCANPLAPMAEEPVGAKMPSFYRVLVKFRALLPRADLKLWIVLRIPITCAGRVRPYGAPRDFRGEDSFSVTVVGTNRGIRGNSIILVHVSVQ